MHTSTQYWPTCDVTNDSLYWPLLQSTISTFGTSLFPAAGRSINFAVTMCPPVVSWSSFSSLAMMVKVNDLFGCDARRRFSSIKLWAADALHDLTRPMISMPWRRIESQLPTSKATWGCVAGWSLKFCSLRAKALTRLSKAVRSATISSGDVLELPSSLLNRTAVAIPSVRLSSSLSWLSKSLVRCISISSTFWSSCAAYASMVSTACWRAVSIWSRTRSVSVPSCVLTALVLRVQLCSLGKKCCWSFVVLFKMASFFWARASSTRSMGWWDLCWPMAAQCPQMATSHCTQKNVSGCACCVQSAAPCWDPTFVLPLSDGRSSCTLWGPGDDSTWLHTCSLHRASWQFTQRALALPSPPSSMHTRQSSVSFRQTVTSLNKPLAPLSGSEHSARQTGQRSTCLESTDRACSSIHLRQRLCRHRRSRASVFSRRQTEQLSVGWASSWSWDTHAIVAGSLAFGSSRRHDAGARWVSWRRRGFVRSNPKQAAPGFVNEETACSACKSWEWKRLV